MSGLAGRTDVRRPVESKGKEEYESLQVYEKCETYPWDNLKQG